MDVRCEQCGTVYEFESDRIRPQGVAVKCTTCGHIFKVFPEMNLGVADTVFAGPDSSAKRTPHPAEAIPTAAATPAPASQSPPATGASEQAKSQTQERRWLIRKPSGEVFRFKELTTLQQWIVREKVSREDEISRTGRVWERLGAISELEPFFAVVDKAREAERLAATRSRTDSSPTPSASAVVSPPGPLTAAGHADLIDARPTQEDAAGESAPYTMGDASVDAPAEPTAAGASLDVAAADGGDEPSWGGNSRAMSGREDPTELTGPLEDDLAAIRGSSSRRLVIAAVAGVAVALCGFLLYVNWDRIAGLFSRKASPTRGASYKAQTLLRMDTHKSFQQAAMQLNQLLASKHLPAERRARALAIKAELYAAWAQSLREQAADMLAPAGTVGRPTDHMELPVAPRTAPRGTSPARALPTPASMRPRAVPRMRTARRHGPRRSHVRRSAALPPEAGPSAPHPRPAAHREVVSPDLRARARALLENARDKARLALALAKQAIALADTALSREALAEASRVAGRPAAEVRRLVARAARLDPDRPILLYTRGMLSLAAGKLKAAQKALERAVDLGRSRWGKPYFRAIVDLARLYALRGETNNAVTTLNGLLAENAEHDLARSLLERLRSASARPRPRVAASVAAKAIADAGAAAPQPRAGTDHPTSQPGQSAETEEYDTLVRRAERFSFAGNQARALALYQRALRRRPSGVEALTGVGYAYLDQGRTGVAISYFRKALGISPAYGEALIGLAEAYNRAGSPRQALNYYKQYLRHHPAGRRSVLAKQNIRELEEKLGQGGARPAGQPDASVPPARTPPSGTPDTRPTGSGDTTPAMGPRPRVVEPPPARTTPGRPPAMGPRPRVVEPPPARTTPGRPPAMGPRPRVVEPPPAR